MTATEIIQTLGMQRHPEGGWYVETFRDENGGERGHSTAIYYLLEQGERSHWHRVKDAAEVWHFYAGSPLKLRLAKDGESPREAILGPDLQQGQRPQVIVKADEWQSAEPLGAFTLVGCTVAPGFEFSKFEMAAPGWEPGR
ncbi:cupin domain-containing protein [Rhizobium sp. FKY42]|uniref:cupin domain-containing protein n=1 Tax=Rhizobium sp. FKY42 TaxID=2562310 RepID=UPI0010C13723|nr:cupin domain-containing protein [Rhizobium sp. FKY42]